MQRRISFCSTHVRDSSRVTAQCRNPSLGLCSGPAARELAHLLPGPGQAAHHGKEPGREITGKSSG